MQDKLQELTDKLYSEGLSRGKAQGEALLAKAKEDAATILANANRQAAEIRANAERDAEEYKAKIESDIKLASAQSLQTVKSDIERAVIFKMAGEPVGNIMSDTSFLKDIIRTVAEKFSAQESSDLELVLPESLKSELQPFIAGELTAMFGSGFKASFSKKVSGGFTIGPADGSYFISFTDETFAQLISAYLHPVTRRLLFGE